MDDDVQKEEQRLLRTMNNRVNAALQNKPKANFTFNSSLGSGSSSSYTPQPRPAQSFTSPPAQSPEVISSPSVSSPSSYTSPPINFSAPQNFANFSGKPVGVNKTSTLEAKSIPRSKSNETIATEAPEIVKHSNANPEEELKALFSDDYERRMKLEEERLTRTLGKRSYVVPKGSAAPAASFAPQTPVKSSPAPQSPPVRAPSPPPARAPSPPPAVRAPTPPPSQARAPSPPPTTPAEQFDASFSVQATVSPRNVIEADVLVAISPPLVLVGETPSEAPAEAFNDYLNTIEDVLN